MLRNARPFVRSPLNSPGVAGLMRGRRGRGTAEVASPGLPALASLVGIPSMEGAGSAGSAGVSSIAGIRFRIASRVADSTSSLVVIWAREISMFWSREKASESGSVVAIASDESAGRRGVA